MNNPIIAQFCKQVGKELLCFPATKRALLYGLEEELNELPDEATVSLAALESRMGDASQVAKELQSSVSPEEERRAVRGKRWKTILMIGGILGVTFIVLLSAILLFLNGPFYVVETIMEG